MKVNELIDLLGKVNPEAEVIMRSSSGLRFAVNEQDLLCAVYDEEKTKADTFTIKVK